MGKISQLSSRFLGILSVILLMSVFVTLSMSFTPIDDVLEDDYTEQNDSTSTSGTTKRYSHWTTTGSCGDKTYHNTIDYGVLTLEVKKGQGTIVVESGTNTTHDVGNTNNSPNVTVTWNCGYTTTDKTEENKNLTTKHTNTVTYTAVPAKGYRFAGWYQNDQLTTPLQGEYENVKQTESFKINGDNYNATSNGGTPTSNFYRYAKFEPIEIKDDTSNPTYTITHPNTDYDDNDGLKQTFTTVGADAIDDFGEVEFTTGPTTTAQWEKTGIEYKKEGDNTGTVTVSYSFNSKRETYRNEDGKREDQAVMTLYNADGTSSGSATITINYYDPEVNQGQVTKPIDPKQPNEEYEGTVTFDVRYADDEADFDIPTFDKIVGVGKWTVKDWTVVHDPNNYSKATVTVNYTFSSTQASGSNSAELTLNSKISNSSQSVTINADFPKLQIAEGQVTLEDLYPAKPSGIYNGTATFPVQYANSKDDFAEPTFSGTTGDGKWSVLNWNIAQDQDDKTKALVTINFTFTSTTGVGNNSAELTLQAKTSNSSQSITINANFPAILILQATNKTDDLYPTNPIATYSGEALFKVQYANSVNDFVSSITDADPTIKWDITRSNFTKDENDPTQADVTLNYSFTGNGSYGGKDDEGAYLYGSRTNAANLQLTVASNNTQTKSLSLNASYPEIELTGSEMTPLKMESATTTETSSAKVSAQYVDDEGDFTTTLNSTTGSDAWQVGEITFDKTNSTNGSGTLNIPFSFKGSGYYGGADEDGNPLYGSRKNSATLTVQVKNNTDKQQTFTLDANYPDLWIGAGTTEVLDVEQGEKKSGTATFPVKYADGKPDFIAPSISDAQGGTWTIDSWDYQPTEGSTLGEGVVTINYTFVSDGTEGQFSATLTLTGQDNAGATTNSVQLIAIIETPSDNEAMIIFADGSQQEYDTFTKALTEANKEENKGCTLKLLKNVVRETAAAGIVTITNTFTLDLNGFTLSRTITAAGQLIHVNAEDITFTITDTKLGARGAVSLTTSANVECAAVKITNGNLVLDNGNLVSTNTNTSNTEKGAVGVYLASATTSFTMNNGKIEATRSQGTYAYAIDAIAGSVVDVNAGTIKATANSMAHGVRLRATLTAEGIAAKGTFKNADISANTNAATAYGIRIDGDEDLATGDKHTTVIEDCKINVTTGTTDAYGIYSYGKIQAARTSITATGTNTVNGIRLEAANYTTKPETQHAGDADLTDVNITATATTNATVYAVYLQSLMVAGDVGTTIEDEKVISANVNIVGGTYIANGVTTGGNYTNSPMVIRSAERQQTYHGKESLPMITIKDANLSAKSEAGNSGAVIYTHGPVTIDDSELTLSAGGNTVYGIYTSDKLIATNTNINVDGTSSVHGIYLQAAVPTTEANKFKPAYAGSAELTNVNIDAETKTSTGAYAVYAENKAMTSTTENEDPTKNKVPAEYEQVAAGNITIEGGSYKAIAATGTAKTISVTTNVTRSITLAQGLQAISNIKVSNATLLAQAKTEANAHVIVNPGNVTIENSTLTADAAQATAYGIYTAGELIATNTNISAEATSSVYGISLYAWAPASTQTTTTDQYKPAYAGSADLTDVNVNAVSKTKGATPGTNTVYAVYAINAASNYNNIYIAEENEKVAQGSININGGSYTAHAAGGTVGAIYYEAANAQYFRPATRYGKEAVSNVTIKNTTLSAIGESAATAYGVSNGGPILIEDTKLTVKAGKDGARGIYTADKLTATNVDIDVDGTSSVYGIYLHAWAPTATADQDKPAYAGSADLTDVNVNAVSKTKGATPGTNTVYAVYAINAVSNCDNTNIPEENEKVAQGSININGGSYTAHAAGGTVGAIYYHTDAKNFRPATALNGKEAVSDVTIKNTTLSAIGESAATAYGVSNGGPILIEDTKLTVKAGKDGARGIYTADKLTATNVDIDVDGTQNVYGVYLYAWVPASDIDKLKPAYAGSAELNNVNITAETKTKESPTGVVSPGLTGAYAVYAVNSASTNAAIPADKEQVAAGDITINGGSYTATAATETAGAVYVTSLKNIYDYTAYRYATTVNGDEAISEVVIQNAQLNVKTNNGRFTYGVVNLGPVTIKDTEINVNTAGQYSFGVFTADELKATNTDINVEGTGLIYGISLYAYIPATFAAKQYAGSAELKNVNVNAESKDKTTSAGTTSAGEGTVYAVYTRTVASTSTNPDEERVAAGDITIEGGSYIAKAAKATAGAIYNYDTRPATLTKKLEAIANLTIDNVDNITAITGSGANAYAIRNMGPVTITNTPITAQSGTSGAYGIYTADKLTATNVDIDVDGTSSVYGINLYAWAPTGTATSIADQYKPAYAGSADLTDVNVNAVSKTKGATIGTSTVYAVYAINAVSNYDNTYIPEENEKVAQGSININGGSYTAHAAGGTVGAIYYHTDAKNFRPATALNGKEAVSNVTIKNTTLSAIGESAATAYGVSNGGPILIEDTKLTVKAGKDGARGIYTADKLTATNVDIDVDGTQNVYGVYLHAWVPASNIDKLKPAYAGSAELNNVNITAETKTKESPTGVVSPGVTGAYAVYAVNAASASTVPAEYEQVAAGDITINGGSYTATAATNTAYGVLVTNSSNARYISTVKGLEAISNLTIHNAPITAKALDGGTAYAVYNLGPITIDETTITATTSLITQTAGANAYGIYTADKLTTNKVDIVATAATGGAYGVYLQSCIRDYTANAYAGDANLVSTNITAQVLNGATAQAVTLTAVQKTQSDITFAALSDANKALYQDVYAYGEFAIASKVNISAGTYKAISSATTARAIYGPARTMTVGGNAVAYPDVTVNGATLIAQAGTNTVQTVNSGGRTIIKNSTLDATLSGEAANGAEIYGIYVSGGRLEAEATEIKVTAPKKASNAGNVTAKGIYAHAVYDGNTANAIVEPGEKSNDNVLIGDIVLNNVDVTAETSGNYSYGLHLSSTQTLLTRTALNNLSEANKNTYGEAYEKNLRGQDHYGYAMGWNAVINGGSYIATADGTTAYGICQTLNALTTDGLGYANGSIDVKNATISATAKGTTGAYGIYAGGQATVTNCDITATSAGTEARGITIYDKTLDISNSNISVEATGATAYGLRGEMMNVNTAYGGVIRRPHIISTDNNVEVTSGDKTSYAISLTASANTVSTNDYYSGDLAAAASAEINGGTYTANANSTAYSIFVDEIKTKNAAKAAPTCIVNGGKFWGKANDTYADICPNGEVGYFVINGGYYTNEANIDMKLGDGMNRVAVVSGTPEYNEGYLWQVTDDMTGQNVCDVYQGNNKTSYPSLEDALDYVNNNSGTYTIVMTANYTLPAGNYILPQDATLLVPYKSDQKTANGSSPEWVTINSKPVPTNPTKPYKKLTFDNGVNMIVKGKIEAGSTLWINQNQWTGIPGGEFGWIYLNEGAHIELESGSYLYAWGYITGKGDINAKNGSTVYEDFQMGDWRGGTTESEVQGNKNGINGKSVFLITDYYVQNIECATTYRPGAKLICYTGCYMEKSIIKVEAKSDPVNLIGTSGAMFIMSESTEGNSTWVKKEYDPIKDQLIWTLNSGASLGSFALKMKTSLMNIDLTTSEYVLPMATNFKIVANEGQINITNDVCFLPGSELEVKKEATVVVPTYMDGKVEKAINVFFYDNEDWVSYGGYYHKIGYSPSWKTCPRNSPNTKLPDAKVLVSGKVQVKGSIWTTKGGANIYSTRENGGKIEFLAAAPASTSEVASSTKKNQSSTLFQLVSGDPTYFGHALNSAWLTNADTELTGEYTETKGAKAGDVYTYMEDVDGVYRWIRTENDGCFTVTNSEVTGTHYFVHPSDFVEVADETGNKDHTFSEKGGERMFINTEANTGDANCYWWDVDPQSTTINGKTCYMVNKEQFDNYGSYYYYNDKVGYWEPVKIKVEFYNDTKKLDNDKFGDYYNYNTKPVYYGATPTRQSDKPTDYSLELTGWDTTPKDPSDEEAEFGYNDLPILNEEIVINEESIVFYAHFKKKYNEYTISVTNPDGTNFWTGRVIGGTTADELYNIIMNAGPHYQASTPEKEYVFDHFEPELQEVTVSKTGNDAYKAVYETPTRKYTITFINPNGDVLQEAEFEHGTVPEYDYSAGDPIYRGNPAFSYQFIGWKNGNIEYKKDVDDLPKVTGNTIYTAVYEETEKMVSVYFKTYQDRDNYQAQFKYGEKPVYKNKEGGDTPPDYTDDDNIVMFTGWDKDLEELSTDITEDGITYTAEYYIAPNTVLDIVDWTKEDIIINGQTFAAANWPYTFVVNGHEKTYDKTDREGDRTLKLSRADLGLQEDKPNTPFTLNVYQLGKVELGNLIGSHTLYVPYIYDANDTYDHEEPNNQKSVIYVHADATLTVEGKNKVAAVYVAPGAELNIEGELTVDKLVLRTTPWKAAVLDYNKLDAKNVYYTRIISDASKYYQFGLPLSVNISDVRLSDGSTPAYSSVWLLKSYSEESRAEKGKQSGEKDETNWVPLTGGQIEGGVGYEMFSASNYYREYYFPVNLDDLREGVEVKYDLDDAGEAHAGWNIVVSPLTGKYDNMAPTTTPDAGLKISLLKTDGSYQQEMPKYIMPAVPFSYQAKDDDNGYLSFASTGNRVPRWQLAAQVMIQTEWLPIRVVGVNSASEYDETSLYVHPTRFENGYEAGIDVAKQSFTATRPLIYTAMPYGNMAFAGVSDEQMTQGVALTTYSPDKQQVTFSLRDNIFLDRLEKVYLCDIQSGSMVDLMMFNYTTNLYSGTTKDRFFLTAVFRANSGTNGGTTTSVDGLTDGDLIVWAREKQILVNGTTAGEQVYCFDAIGHLVGVKTATEQTTSFNVPTTGVYIIKSADKVKRVITK